MKEILPLPSSKESGREHRTAVLQPAGGHFGPEVGSDRRVPLKFSTMNIAALVSGGVDSSVVVHRLKEMGYDPTIFYIRIGMEQEDGFIDCPSEEDIEITTYIAKKYGCKFEIVPLHREYWDNVVKYTIDTVKRGLTPNPDMMCNKLIKFGAFEEKYGKDFDWIATGHYATTTIIPDPVLGNLRQAYQDGKRPLWHDGDQNIHILPPPTDPSPDEGDPQIEWSSNGFQKRIGIVGNSSQGNGAIQAKGDGQTVFLSTAADHVKDQTYFLGQISQTQLSKLVFPIGDLPKKEVRAIAEAAKLPSATRKDSQGICFLGKINYNDFIRRYLGIKIGPIIEKETGKRLGYHHGFWFHTIGQRKGLGLSGGPWYVVDKDIPGNILYVSKGFQTQAQYGKTIRLSGFRYMSVNLLGEPDRNHPAEVCFKIRHTPEFTKAKFYRQEDGLHILESERPIQGIAAGQFGVVYTSDAKLCLGSGIIFGPHAPED